MRILKGEEPNDYPSKEDIVRRMNTIKGNVRKERGKLSTYMMSKVYAKLLEEIVRSEEKIKNEDVPWELCRK